MITQDYIAGFIDGEGTVYVHRRVGPTRPTRVWPNLTVSNTDFNLLKEIADSIGTVVKVKKFAYCESRLGKRPIYYLSVTKWTLLRQLLPLLREQSKSQRARLLLEWWPRLRGTRGKVASPFLQIARGVLWQAVHAV